MFSLQREKSEGHPYHVTGQRATGETIVFIGGLCSCLELFGNSNNKTQVRKYTMLKNTEF